MANRAGCHADFNTQGVDRGGKGSRLNARASTNADSDAMRVKTSDCCVCLFCVPDFTQEAGEEWTSGEASLNSNCRSTGERLSAAEAD